MKRTTSTLAKQTKTRSVRRVARWAATSILATLLAQPARGQLLPALPGPPAADSAVVKTPEPSSKPGSKSRGPRVKAPRVYHVPMQSVANPSGDLVVSMEIRDRWRAKTVRLSYRRIAMTQWAVSEFKRDSRGRQIAIIPEGVVSAPGFEYFIASELKDGTTALHFASPQSPQRVVVRDVSMGERAARRLARHDGAQHEFELAYRFINNGTLTTTMGGSTTDERDNYHRLTLGYTHRLLSDYIYQIGFDFVVLGAKLGVNAPVDGSIVANQDRRQPGIYLGRARASWEFLDSFGIDVMLAFGANQTGFVVGGGGALRIGRLTGTNFEVGVEVVKDTGYDVWLQMAWDTVPHFTMSHDLPHCRRHVGAPVVQCEVAGD
jgi:hypothetical protein